MNKKAFIPSPVGLSSVLVCLCALCLAVFSLLSLSTASADLRLQQKYADSVRDGGQAQCEAELIIAKLREGTVPEGVSLDENGNFSFQTEADGVCAILVQGYFENGAPKLTRYQKIRNADWEPDGSRDLIDFS